MVDITTVDIAATMSTELKYNSGRLVAVLACGMGVFLLFLSVPRVLTFAYLAKMPPQVTRALKVGVTFPQAMLSEAESGYADAAFILPGDGLIQQDLGRLVLRQAELLREFPDQRQEMLLAISSHFRASIAAAPSRAFPWVLEAYVRMEMSAPPEEVSDLLRMSYFLGPHEGSNLLLRMRVACRMWEQLDADVQDYMRDDFREIWRYTAFRRQLIEIYLDASLPVRSIIRGAILNNEQDKHYFNSLLLKAVRVQPPS